MGLATIYLYSLKEHNEIHKIPQFGVHRPNNEKDTTIWKCQNCTEKCIAIPDAAGQLQAIHFFVKFWHFWMAVSCLRLGLFTPNPGILWISAMSPDNRCALLATSSTGVPFVMRWKNRDPSPGQRHSGFEWLCVNAINIFSQKALYPLASQINVGFVFTCK